LGVKILRMSQAATAMGGLIQWSGETASFGQALLGLILHALTLEQSRDQSLRDSD
jgi:hypothetical protein